MQALFIHGLARTPLSGIKLMHALRMRGIPTEGFGYLAALESVEGIRQRLYKRIVTMAARGEYVLIGHSLGGVLARIALSNLPEGTRLPKRIFLIASPTHSPRLARKLQNNPAFRFLTGDCGQLLASEERMDAIGAPPVPVTSIVGNIGLKGRFSPFADEDNDGILSITESHAPWISEELPVTSVHTWLPMTDEVAQLIWQRLGR